MRELEKVPVKRMPEVIERAARLQERDAQAWEEEEEKGALVLAAKDVGISADYMQRAAADLQRDALMKRAQRQRMAKVAVALLVLFALGGGVYWATRDAPSWEDGIEVGASGWALKTDPKSEATLSFVEVDGAKGQVAVLEIKQFGPKESKFYVNVASADPINLDGHEALTVRVKSKGVPSLRVDLEASATERWRSQPLTLGEEWAEVVLPLSRFERQTRASAEAAWRVDAWASPKDVKVVFKAGDFINDAKAKGTIWIDAVSSR
jgi:hypothetical protein